MLISQRLQYEQVSLAKVDRFHALVQDPHVRRYLMDDEVFPLEWSEARVRESDDLFARLGVGLWLVTEKESSEHIGFCGFLELPSVLREPQLVYALRAPFTGRGYATEMTQAAIAHARARAGFEEIVAAVDEGNRASSRVLEKLGFTQTGTVDGPLGNVFTYRLD